MTFTRKAGWGHPGESGTLSGAPFDASAFAGAGAGVTPPSAAAKNRHPDSYGRHSVERKPVATGAGYTNGHGALAHDDQIV